MNRIDLHVHSNKSDGSFSPSELVDYALEKGLSAFALTDHDTTEGIDEALEAAEGKPIEVIPGIEFSSDYEGKDVHILGLYIDYHTDFFQRRLQAFVNGREIRNQEMCRRLTERGVDISYEELQAEYPGSVITRGHYAKYMYAHGYVNSLKEAFDRYIGDRAPCFVERKKITPMRAVEIILKAGGIPILAHPILYHMSDERLEKLVSDLKDIGLMGIEAIYSTYAPAEERQIRRLAEKYDLCISGGSDFHGANKPGLDMGTGYGKLLVPEEVLTDIKKQYRKMKEDPRSYRKTKILFTDLDGTLLNSEKQISPYTRSVLEKWCSAGHKLALCSGRDINSVSSVRQYLQLKLPGMYLIGYNGGQIVDCDTGETVYRAALTREQAEYVKTMAGRYSLHFQTYSDTHIICEKEDEELLFYRQVIKTPVQLSSRLDMLKEGTCKCLIIELHDRDRVERFRKDMEEWAKAEHVTMMFSNAYYLEVFPEISGKGAAVRKLCEMLHINPYLAVAAGDEENDLSMILAAGCGIAMKNGSEKVREAATVITDTDNDHDGLAGVLYDLI